MELVANNYDFPVYLLRDARKVNNHLPFQQLRAYLTGTVRCDEVIYHIYYP